MPEATRVWSNDPVICQKQIIIFFVNVFVYVFLGICVCFSVCVGLCMLFVCVYVCAYMCVCICLCLCAIMCLYFVCVYVRVACVVMPVFVSVNERRGREGGRGRCYWWCGPGPPPPLILWPLVRPVCVCVCWG